MFLFECQRTQEGRFDIRAFARYVTDESQIDYHIRELLKAAEQSGSEASTPQEAASLKMLNADDDRFNNMIVGEMRLTLPDSTQSEFWAADSMINVLGAESLEDAIARIETSLIRVFVSGTATYLGFAGIGPLLNYITGEINMALDNQAATPTQTQRIRNPPAGGMTAF